MPDPAQPLEDVEDDPNEIELAWVEEIRRRRAELDDGSVKPLTKEEFLRRLREAK